jgi:hypothetical protein
MRTDPQTDEDRSIMREAINGLYEAANLTKPINIVFVPSPLVGQVASGFAAAIWHLRENNKGDAGIATRDATSAVSIYATIASTHQAVGSATFTGNSQLTAEHFEAVMARKLTTDDTQATISSTLEKGWIRKLAKEIHPSDPDLLCQCAQSALSMYNGGNMWAPGVDFLSFFRHIVKLPLDYSKWAHYETAAIHGGFRWMHPKFCVISDFPERLLVDAANRPHSSDGPSHRWRDGFSIYHWHGFRLPVGKEWVIADKAKITAENILEEGNVELRRVMCEVSGWAPLMDKAKEIASDVDGNGLPRRLLSLNLKGQDIRLLEVVNGSLEPDGSRRKFILGTMVGARTPHEAVAMSYGVNPEHYKEGVRT